MARKWCDWGAGGAPQWLGSGETAAEDVLALEEAAAAFFDEAAVVDLGAEVAEAVFEGGDGHVGGEVIDVEERAGFPCFRGEETVGSGEPVVEWGVREGGHDGDLDLVEPGVFDELEDAVEAGRVVVVEAEDEAAVDGDAGVLDAGDGFGVAAGLVAFPVGLVFDAVERGGVGAFEADEDLGAAAFLHETEEFVVPCDGDVGFGEPAEAEGDEGAGEVAAAAAVGERVIVGEFDERVGPEVFDGEEFVDDAGDGFGAEAWGEAITLSR